MKKLTMIITMSLISLSTIFAANPFGTVVARVKLTETQLIKLDKVEENIKLIEAQQGRAVTDEQKDMVLDSLISSELLKQAAKRDGVVVTEEIILERLKPQLGANATDQQVKDATEKQYKRPWDEVSKLLIEQLTLQEYVKLAGAEDFKKYSAAPGNEEVINYYNIYKTKYVNNDMVRVDHIFYSTKGKDDATVKAKAEAAMLSIKQGKKSFDSLVQDESDDRGSVMGGGDMGYISRDNSAFVKVLGMDFINKLFEQPMDEIKGVFKSNSGYHIIKVTEKRSARILNITDPVSPGAKITVAQEIANKIAQSKATTAVAQVTEVVVERLKEEADIKIIDKSIPWKK